MSCSSTISFMLHYVLNWSDKITKVPESFLKCALRMCIMLGSDRCPKHLEKDCVRAFEKIVQREAIIEGSLVFHGPFVYHLVKKVLTLQGVSPTDQYAHKPSSTDVNRLYKNRQLLKSIPWEDPSAHDIHVALLRAALAPVMLKSDQGIKFIAFVYALHRNLTTDLHDVLKNTVPGTSNLQMKAYSRIIFEAWRSAEGGCKIEIEENIQDWMNLGVVCDAKISKKVRDLLLSFHVHRDPLVEDMLYRLYEPILWRNLKVANWKIRHNATAIFSVAFPLVSMDHDLEQTNQMLVQQYKHFEDLMRDEHPAVRDLAIKGVCRALRSYWEMTPHDHLSRLLLTVIESGRDRTSPLVRASVCQGLASLMKDCALSHPILKNSLTRISHLLTDRSPIVRAAYVELLDIIQEANTMSVFDFQTNQVLLAQMAFECARARSEAMNNTHQSKDSHTEVAEKLAGILSASFFEHAPENQIGQAIEVGAIYPLAMIGVFTHCVQVKPNARLRFAARAFQHVCSQLIKWYKDGTDIDPLDKKAMKFKKHEKKPVPPRTTDDAKFIANMQYLLRCCEMTLQSLIEPKVSVLHQKLVKEVMGPHMKACHALMGEETFQYLFDLEHPIVNQILPRIVACVVWLGDNNKFPQTKSWTLNQFGTYLDGTDGVRLDTLLRYLNKTGCTETVFDHVFGTLDDGAQALQGNEAEGDVIKVRRALETCNAIIDNPHFLHILRTENHSELARRCTVFLGIFKSFFLKQIAITTKAFQTKDLDNHTDSLFSVENKWVAILPQWFSFCIRGLLHAWRSMSADQGGGPLGTLLEVAGAITSQSLIAMVSAMQCCAEDYIREKTALNRDVDDAGNKKKGKKRKSAGMDQPAWVEQLKNDAIAMVAIYSSFSTAATAAAHFGRPSVTAYLKHALDLQHKFADIADTLTAVGQKGVAWTNGAGAFRQLASVTMPAHEMVRAKC